MRKNTGLVQTMTALTALWERKWDWSRPERKQRAVTHPEGAGLASSVVDRQKVIQNQRTDSSTVSVEGKLAMASCKAESEVHLRLNLRCAWGVSWFHLSEVARSWVAQTGKISQRGEDVFMLTKKVLTTQFCT